MQSDIRLGQNYPAPIRVERRIRDLLRRSEEWVKRDLQIAAVQKGVPSTVFHEVLADLANRGLIAVDGRLVRRLSDWELEIPAPLPARPDQPSPLRAEQKAHAWDRTEGRCWYCGTRLNPFRNLAFDRLNPIPAGQSDPPLNLVPACEPCQTNKAGRPLEQYRESLARTTNGQTYRFWYELER